MARQGKTIIGRVEKVSFPKLGIFDVPAKIDTGADTSTIWASDISEVNGVLKFKLFGKKAPYYTGKELNFTRPNYLQTRVASSFGHKELRYVIKLSLELGGRNIKGTFTLSNRSAKTYPILVGRKLLNRKFLVDVSKGTPLKDLEERKRDRMRKELEVFELWEKKK
ncbi:MAG TPA: RimK/LysX family protein [Candidatus Saccharimonadales bacterium]|nr:RimK/LysX family protein [Candidatus Saccharimonadales bacterium]